MIEIYDNGGKTLDRYTIFSDKTDNCIGSDENGAGFYQHCTGTRGRHLGKKISIDKLSKELQDRLTQERILDR